MDFLTALLQMISAFVIFVAGYLVLMVSVIVSFVLATCIYKGGCLARAYTVKSASLDHNVSSQVIDDTDSAARLRAVFRNCQDGFHQRWIATKNAVNHRLGVHT